MYSGEAIRCPRTPQQFISPVQKPFHPDIMSTLAKSYGTETYLNHSAVTDAMHH